MKKKSEINFSNDIYREIGIKLRYLREEKGYTLLQFCEKFRSKFNVKLNPNLIGKIERSESKIPTHIFLLICQFYKVNLQFFFSGADEYSDESQIIHLLSESPRRRLISKFLVSAVNEPWKYDLLADIIQILLPRIEGHFHDLGKENPNVRNLKAASKERV
ncbi:MAG: helix-turn-helix domain-containing protein [Leptospira sp.]|nr:helix-turn-helix domain-containing protein [Leptospira sp.]